MPSIYITNGPLEGEFYNVTDDEVTIGRSAGNTIQIDDEQISGSHLAIRLDMSSGKFSLEDLKSTNGTWMDGRSITTSTILGEGDLIDIGSSQIEFSYKTYDNVDEAMEARSSKPSRTTDTLIDDSNKKF